jgi:coenzyme PQQ synthesis protein D (PqqD)
MNHPCYVARNSQVAARRLGDEMMMMSASTSTLFTLNDVAAAICEAADGVTPLREIIKNKICNEYDVALEAALADAENLVQQLAIHGILVVSDRPIVGSGIAPREVS